MAQLAANTDPAPWGLSLHLSVCPAPAFYLFFWFTKQGRGCQSRHWHRGSCHRAVLGSTATQHSVAQQDQMDRSCHPPGSFCACGSPSTLSCTPVPVLQLVLHGMP